MVEVADPRAGQRTLVLDATGTIGAWVTQGALHRGAEVAGLVGKHEVPEARGAGIDRVFTSLPSRAPPFDLVLDAMGGAVARAALRLLRPGGTLVSSVERLDPELLGRHDVSARRVTGGVTLARLGLLSRWIDARWISVVLGEVLPLQDAILAHRMVEGLAPKARGSIVLRLSE
jgi:NADPH:quinone reductase-like Zn-dependent oxidoreductase